MLPNKFRVCLHHFSLIFSVRVRIKYVKSMAKTVLMLITDYVSKFSYLTTTVFKCGAYLT